MARVPAAVALVLGGAAWVAIAGTVLVPSPALADPVADCSTTSGVIVVVDLRPWGGQIERGCDGTLTATTTGYDALEAAGFTPAGDEQDGPAFMCRIDGYPTVAQDACVTTPPATAYWSYWHADAGQDTWTYSQYGAMSYDPPPGSVDAWSFGSGSQPSFPPSLVMATNTDPVGGGSTTTTTVTTTIPATTTPVTTPVTPATTGTGRAATSSTSIPTAPRPATPAAGPSGTAGSTTSTPAAPVRPSTSTSAPATGTGPGGTGSPSARSPKVVDASPVLARHGTPAGSPVPLAVGAVVIALVAAGAVVIARRRRRTG